MELIELLPIDPAWLWLGLKLVYLFGVGLYVVFAIVVYRQAVMMLAALNGALELPIKLVALTHLGIAVLMFLLVVVVL